MQPVAKRIVDSTRFQYFIIALIVGNGVILGLETSASIEQSLGTWLHRANDLILAVFVLEIALKMIALWPKPARFFTDGWNVFDFAVVAGSLVPATGDLAMIARLLRLLRVLRLVSAVPELRLIVATLIRSLPSMGHVIVLMSILFYVYGVAGYHLFNTHDPTLWGTLGRSLLTLFRVVTLEDWTDVMYTAMTLHPMAWIYFVSFVIIGTFVIVNLFIAVVINNLEEAKQERLRQMTVPVSRERLSEELAKTQAALAQLREQLDRAEVGGQPSAHAG